MSTPITLIKLGGSLITDKTVEASFRRTTVQRLASELKAVFMAQPSLKIIIGHGSGSFGHFEAKRHDTINGVSTSDQWLGFCKVGAVASKLNQLVTEELISVDLPVFSIRPSSLSLAQDGTIHQMNLQTLKSAINTNLIPLVHGDISFDSARGGTIISTETIFTYLVQNLLIERIILVGTVDGVHDLEQSIIPEITTQNYPQIRNALGGSDGTDVTGGMLTKVDDMLKLVQQHNNLTVQIINGNQPNLLRDILLDEATTEGTTIRK